MKVVGVERPLNEIAQELIRQGFEVTTDINKNNKRLDAMVYYGEMSDTVLKNTANNYQILKIDAEKYNIDQIVKKIKEI